MIELSMTVTCTRCGHTETFTEPYKRLYETEFATKGRHVFFGQVLAHDMPDIGVWREFPNDEEMHLCEKCNMIAQEMSRKYNNKFDAWVAEGEKDDEPVDKG